MHAQLAIDLTRCLKDREELRSNISLSKMLSTYGLIFVSSTHYLLLTVIHCAQCERGCFTTVGALGGQLLYRLSHRDHVQHLQHNNAV